MNSGVSEDSDFILVCLSLFVHKFRVEVLNIYTLKLLNKIESLEVKGRVIVPLR